jgi:site-specific DNA recombinase
LSQAIPLPTTAGQRSRRSSKLALVKLPTFTVIVVHSFSRFFRDQLQFEFYVRKLAKNGVRLICITQDIGDDTVSVMMARS